MGVENINYPSSRIIALGFSAGGYEAAGDFFDDISPAPGLAFAIIDHKYFEVEYSQCNKK